MAHSFIVKVYYEDTDAAGVVYYANYLRFLERARTEYLEELGAKVAQLHSEGILLVVTHVDIHYRRPGKLGDSLEVRTEIEEVKAVRVTLRQDIYRGDTLLTEAHVTIACVDPEGKPQRLPPVFQSP
jgi:acyl-CoA thioester hydrolase